MNRENLLEVFAVEDEFERQEFITLMFDRAKTLKFKKELERLIAAFQRSFNKTMGIGDESYTRFGYPLGPEMRCGAWIADENGVRISRGILGMETACYHPILPVERFVNLETKTEKIKIAYLRDGIWKDITVEKGKIASASKIVALADFGIAVNSENAKWLVKFLSDLENFNEIPIRNSTSKLGWNGEDFLPYDQEVVFDSSVRFSEVVNAVEECGSYDIWLNTVKEIRQNREHFEPQLAMSVSFASVLLRPLSLLPFVFNLSGRSGNGKTVSLMVAASIWANPGNHRFLVEIESTQTGFEVRLDLLNDLPLMIDDFSKIQNKFDDRFTDLIYMLTSGRGKDRSNVDLGLNSAKTWCNVTLGAMERPLVSETMRGGAINRVLDYTSEPGDIFGSAKKANRIVELIKENYGFAGKIFVDAIREYGMERLSDKRKEFEDAIREEAKAQGSDKEDKQILPLSAILTADWLATEVIFKDDIYLDIGKMVAQLADVQEVSEFTRGYDYIIGYITSHENEFFPIGDNDEYKGKISGFERDGYMYINTNTFRDIAYLGNFSPTAFCREALQEGILSATDGFRKQVKHRGIHGKYYCIKLPTEQVNDDGFIPAGEGNEIERVFEKTY